MENFIAGLLIGLVIIVVAGYVGWLGERLRALLKRLRGQ